MATSQKEKQHQLSEGAFLIPQKYQHVAAVLTIFLSLVVFFHEVVFEGKVFVAADNIASKSWDTALQDAKQEGIFPLWNPYIFCGMPGYASMTFHGDRAFDISVELWWYAIAAFTYLTLNSEISWELFYYFILGVGVYFFAFDRFKNKIAALVAGLGVMNSTAIVSFVMIGHMTKVPVVCWFPWIFLLVERLREKFSLWQSLVLVLLLHLMYQPMHLQMIFYVYFAFGFYYLYYILRGILKKEDWKSYLRSGTLLVAASCMAFLMTSDKYFSVLEYSKYSMRGTGPIVQSPQPGKAESGSSTGGLDFDYATQWSFSPGEVLTFLVPSLYGLGWHDYSGELTRYQPARLNTYFGPKPFTDVPDYMGIVILVLAIIGFWKNRKDSFVQFSSVLIIVSLLISFGKEFSLLYAPMFEYFPMFNKFRIPSMILVLVQIMMPILAGYGIVSLIPGISDAKENRKWRLFALGAGVLFVLSVIGRGAFVAIYEAFFPEQEVARKLSLSYGNNQAVLDGLYRIITDMVASDLTVALALLTATFGCFILYWNRRLRYFTLSGVLLAAVLFDLWRIGFKSMETHPHTKSAELFSTPEFVKFLQRDTTLFRTLQFENGRPPYDNSLAYWRIQSAYGYQGAKMRQIQDVFDVVGLGNPLLWGLMNVKYIISDRPDSTETLIPVFRGDKYVMRNRADLPRAFFVNRLEVMQGIDILRNIKETKFDPRDVAYLMEDPKIALDVPTDGALAQYTRYGLQDVEVKASATGNNLLFLSESWYPEGWRAFVDGVETPIYRVNYMFRGVVVPRGEHTIAMKFEPRGFFVGKQLVLWINIVVLGTLIFIVLQQLSVRYKTTRTNKPPGNVSQPA